eukprot:TRINITY_DN16034_c0_g2_i3.p1 TRINITY_DN16034_c0_g2~~TRINITY_DN16034_c0_g2_i3.p1  ORF type:complete len:168 (-),score=7.61 TRINITY_DN16034_c0_g2_i3:137-640(-)
MSIRTAGSTRTPSPPSTEKSDTRIYTPPEGSTRVGSKSGSPTEMSASTKKSTYSPDVTPLQSSRKISFGATSPISQLDDSKKFSTSTSSLETRKKGDSLETSSRRSEDLEISSRRGEDGIAVVSAMFASSGFSTKKKQGPSPPRGLGSTQEIPTFSLDSSSHSSSSS